MLYTLNILFFMMGVGLIMSGDNSPLTLAMVIANAVALVVSLRR